MLEQYTQILGSQDAAIQRICMKFDIYFNEKVLATCKKEDMSRSRIKVYIRQINLQQYAGKTYDTYLAEKAGEEINSLEEAQDIVSDGERITKPMFERWQGNSVEDMVALEEHYKMLKKTNPNADHNQEIFIKDLCNIHLMKITAFKKNDVSTFEKCIKMYRDTFKQAGLQTVQEDDGSSQNTLGINTEIISQYTPEEFYKDKKLYEDFDELGKYFDIHVKRPLENLMLGNKNFYDIGDNNET
jgi:hypothetical protein